VSQASVYATELVVVLLLAGLFWHHYGKSIAFIPVLLVITFMAFVNSTHASKSSTRWVVIVLGWVIIGLVILLLLGKLLLDNQKHQWVQPVYNFL
jgi:hypothetical protein